MVKREKNIPFSIARVFAVISIVSAHIDIDGAPIIDKVLSAIGSVGVIVFIILSGYFYNPEKYLSIFDVIRKKTSTIIVPWIFMASLTYVVYNISNLSVIGWILWLVGYKTYLYYLTILMLCYLVFYKRNNLFLYLSMAVTVISLYLTAFGKMNGIIDGLCITNYLNIFNWLGYFSIGCIMRNFDIDKIQKHFEKRRVVYTIIFVILWALICIFDIEVGYFSVIGLPYQLIGVAMIFGVSTCRCLNKKWIHMISDMTFSVYLVHMPIISILKGLYNYTHITQIISPIIIILISIAVVQIGCLISNRIHLKKIYSLFVGLR